MYNADRSASGYIRMLKAKTLAEYHNRNPNKNDYGGEKPSSPLTQLLRIVGQNELCTNDSCCEPVCDLSGSVNMFPFLIDNTDYPSYPDFETIQSELSDTTGQTIVFPSPPDGYPVDREIFLVFFPEACNATSYTAKFYNPYPINVPIVQNYIGMYNTPSFTRTGYIIVYNMIGWDYAYPVTGIITASNECSQSEGETSFGCFLAGAQVAIADGSFKAIETVAVGDQVRGAFGEINTVTGLHRPLLGAGCIANINNEHKTTTHHPHVAADKKIYCMNPRIINSFTYGKKHKVIIDNVGNTENRVMYGLHPARILKLEVGVELQTLTGARRVDTLETIKMSPFTQVYHLAVDGSHTFMVDGYAVTGWPREDDFDYDAWVRRA
jgi:hypothetical protein